MSNRPRLCCPMSDQERFREVFYEAIRLADVAQRTHFQMHPDSEGFRYWEAVAYYCWSNRRDLEDAETLRDLAKQTEQMLSEEDGANDRR